jgi:hypothetical protein
LAGIGRFFAAFLFWGEPPKERQKKGERIKILTWMDSFGNFLSRLS